MKGFAMAAFLVALLSSNLQAQQVYRYTNSTAGIPNSVAANATGTNLARVNGAALPASPCGTGFSSVQWSTAGVVNFNGPAVEFNVTPATNYYLNLTSFSIGLRRNSSGPPIVSFAYSTDGGVSWVLQPTSHAPFTSSCGSTQTATWDFPDFSTGTPLKFRIFGYSTIALATGQLQLLNINLNGTVSLVPLGTAASITAQPTAQTVCEGSNASFTVATGGTPTPVVQWQKSTNGGITWSNITGANALTYSFASTLADNNHRFRAYASNANGADTSVFALLTVNAQATASAGSNGVICSSSNYPVSGTVGGGASSGTWSTSGDGTFANANQLSTVYIPGAADKAAGSVTLTLTSNDPSGPCPSATSSLTLTIENAATVNAGADQTICADGIAQLNGAVGGSAASSNWTSLGDGSFQNASAALTAYTPGAGDKLAGSVALVLTTDDPSGVCNAVSDTVIISVNSLPVVNAGADFGICSSGNATLAGSVTGSTVSGSWTTAGDGTFNNINFMNAIYYPGPGDISSGSVTLTLTSSDPAGPCGSVSDQVLITITSPPVAPAAISGPINVCPGTNGVVYTISPVAGATSYSWSVPSWVTLSGGGASVSLNFASTIANSGTFVSVKSSNSCGTSADSSKLYVRHAIDVPQFVFPQSIVCANTSGVQYKIKPIEGYTSITWSVPAGTSIVSSNDSIVIINFGPAFTSGNVTATATHPCMTTTRSTPVSQGITRIPGNISGPAFGVCDSTVTYSINPVLGAVSYQWTAPAGATILGASNGLSLTVQFAAGYATGTLSVVSFNSCGLQSGARNLTVRGIPQGPSTITGPATICANQSGVAYSIAPTPATWSYLWTVPTTASIVAGQGTTAITVNFGAGGGSVNVRSVRPCGVSGVKSLGVTVTCRENSALAAFQVYPNPASDLVYIDGLASMDDDILYEVVDISGRKCFGGRWSSDDRYVFSTADLNNGVYLLRLRTAEGWQATRFVVQH